MNKIKHAVSHLMVVLGVILLCALVRYELRIVSISGPSMEPTFTDGELIRYADWNPTLVLRGDVVLFQEHGKGKTLIKRVIGLPGETISIVEDEIYINGEKLTSYVYGTVTDAGILTDTPLLLMDGEYFCMGDNYENSRDSRAFGPIKDSWMTGLVIWEK